MSSQESAQLVLSRLVALGIEHVILCPGSRSAPLAYGLAELERAGAITLHVETDERVAAFVALGIGRASGIPAPVVTTSGSAVANLHPAAVEAYHSGVPFIALTADRPEWMRGSGANQTTNQVGILGPNLVDQADLTAEQIIADPEEINRLVGLSWNGPVHINVSFENPLNPEGAVFDVIPTRGSFNGDVRALQARASNRTSESGQGIEPERLDDRSTVIVAGPGTPYAEILGRAGAGTVPIIAEPACGERNLAEAVPAGRILADVFANDIERVIVVGHPTLSRPVTQLISRSDIEVIAVANDPVPTDPGRVGRVVEVMPEIAPQPRWLARWQRAGEAAWKVGRDLLGNDLDALGAAAVIADAPGQWFLGASNVIRDVDLLAGHPDAVFHANRGLAGIDGTMSTTRGMARILGPMKVAVGDLTFIHDLGGLVLTRGQAEPAADIVVIDDSGGGIFATLEHGQDRYADTFERVFRTAKSLDIPGAARAFGWEAVEVTDRQHLTEVLALPPAGRVIRVACERPVTEVRAKRTELARAMAFEAAKAAGGPESVQTP